MLYADQLVRVIFQILMLYFDKEAFISGYVTGLSNAYLNSFKNNVECKLNADGYFYYKLQDQADEEIIVVRNSENYLPCAVKFYNNQDPQAENSTTVTGSDSNSGTGSSSEDANNYLTDGGSITISLDPASAQSVSFRNMEITIPASAQSVPKQKSVLLN